MVRSLTVASRLGGRHLVTLAQAGMVGGVAACRRVMECGGLPPLWLRLWCALQLVGKLRPGEMNRCHPSCPFGTRHEDRAGPWSGGRLTPGPAVLGYAGSALRAFVPCDCGGDSAGARCSRAGVWRPPGVDGRRGNRRAEPALHGLPVIHGTSQSAICRSWIPACAGMTTVRGSATSPPLLTRRWHTVRSLTVASRWGSPSCDTPWLNAPGRGCGHGGRSGRWLGLG